MAQPNSCPACGAPLHPASPARVCPACLLASVIDDRDHPSERSTLTPGETVARFRITRVLGRGGMATVYEAEEGPPLQRTVALKVLPPEFLHDTTFEARFRDEARIIASLAHHSIVPIYASGIDSDVPWMSMRLFSGSLATRLGRPLPLDVTTRILRDVAEALDHAHAHKILHRDVKPSNILLDEDGRACVGDFGLARLIERSDGLTTPGTIVGTPHYMAPERSQNEPADHRSDLYSLGIVAYEMLTGATPFVGDSPIAVAMQHVSSPVPVPPRETVPYAVFEVLRKALAMDPADRWGSAREFVAALETAGGADPAFVWRRRVVGITTAMALVIVAAIAVLRPPANTSGDAAFSPSIAPDRSSRGGSTITPVVGPTPSLPPTPAVSSSPSTPYPGPAPTPDVRKTTTPTPVPTPVAVPTPRPTSSPEGALPSGDDDEREKEAAKASGGNVVIVPPPPPPPVVTAPILVHKVNPTYPPVARRLQIQGEVVVRATVGLDGAVGNVEVVRSDNTVLNQAAMRAVAQYRYKPGVRNGVPEAMPIQIVVSFVIE